MAPLAISAVTSTEFSTGNGAAIVFCGGIAGDAEGERVAEILVGDADGAVDLRDVLRWLSPATSAMASRVGRGVDRRHVVGAGDGDHQVLGADIAVAVIDLGHISERERVALAQPVEVGGGRVVVPADGLLLAIGGERIEADGATGDQRRNVDGVLNRQRRRRCSWRWHCR